MKSTLRICLTLVLVMFISVGSVLPLKAQNVTIIESITGNTWAHMDTIWRGVAIGLGYNAKVVQQSALDALDSLADADILIVASSNISFSSTNHLQTVIDFVKSGRPAYIQSEYLTSFQGNNTFDTLMKVVGAKFSWVGTISGQLVPMKVLGAFAQTPDTISYLNYFNYGVNGHGGAHIDSFLQYGNGYFGFYYHDAASCNGAVITVSDEDWVWMGSSLTLMTNIVSRLVRSYNECYNGTNKIIRADEINIYPNPFSDLITMNVPSKQINRIDIVNELGQVVQSELIGPGDKGLNISINTSALPAGMYYARMAGGNSSFVQKIIKL